MASAKMKRSLRAGTETFLFQIYDDHQCTIDSHVCGSPQGAIEVYMSLSSTEEDDPVKGLHSWDRLTTTHRDGETLIEFMRAWNGECDFELADSQGGIRFSFYVKSAFG